jgi:hypothetical protein
MTIYRSRSINQRRRRTKHEIQEVKDATYTTLEEDNPMSVRQLFYRLVAKGVIEKTQSQYHGTVVRLLGDMRREKVVPFHWIADSTRWTIRPPTYSSLEAMLENAASSYRRALWDNQGAYVEIWCESDAIAGVISSVTRTWDVPLMVVRGYSSLTYLHSCGEDIEAYDRPAYLYYFGDYDPSGRNIPEVVEREIRGFAPSAEFYFERVAVTEEQIQQWNLPTNPAKESDPRSKQYKGPSVEIEAIPPDRLRALVQDCINQHMDPEPVATMLQAERSEKEILIRMIAELAASKPRNAYSHWSVPTDEV